MKIPKKIQNLIEKREKLALKLMDVTSRLDSWLEENGADLTDSDLKDSTISGCMIYSDPGSARINVEDYIKNKMWGK